MGEQNAAVEKDQVYMSNEDRRRGVIRTIAIERTVFTKRGYEETKQLYAVGVSRIDADHKRPDLIGKKRRVFLKVSRLLSADYSLVTDLTPADLELNMPQNCSKHASLGPC